MSTSRKARRAAVWLRDVEVLLSLDVKAWARRAWNKAVGRAVGRVAGRLYLRKGRR